ncbi:MAG: PAS domain S-box protein, partial [Candidatus Moranbacteria bacterium]|nr:PAS domain S-box protein [Candidatus Moranbacteria bacterium]
MNNDNLYRRSEQENMSGDALQTDIIDGTAIKKISALIEAMPDMIFVMHRDGTVLEIYGSVPEKLIAPADQLIGASIRNCFDADEFERHLKLYEKCIQNNESGVIEFELTINGRKMQFLSRIKPIDDQRLLTIVQDITRLRQVDEKVHESEERYRAYVDNAPLGVFVANKEGRYLEVNEEACRITGYAREELLARNFIDFIDSESIVSAEVHFAKLQAEGRSSG